MAGVMTGTSVQQSVTAGFTQCHWALVASNPQQACEYGSSLRTVHAFGCIPSQPWPIQILVDTSITHTLHTAITCVSRTVTWRAYAAEALSSKVVEAKLAACVNILPGLTSVYWWDGKVNKDPELMLIIKTRR